MRCRFPGWPVGQKAVRIAEENLCLDELAYSLSRCSGSPAHSPGEEIGVAENRGAVVADGFFDDRSCLFGEMFVVVTGVTTLQFSASASVFRKQKPGRKGQI